MSPGSLSWTVPGSLAWFLVLQIRSSPFSTVFWSEPQYNLSNFIRLGLGPSYKFWEVINYKRGINDVAQSLIPMTVCPLLYNLSNFIRLGPGPSYKFWEVINYRRGINDVAQSLIPMTVCPLLYHCPFSSNLQLTLSQPTLSTPSTSLSYHTMGKYNSTPGHLTEGMRITLCQQKRRHPALTQWGLKEWLWTTHGVCVTQATINLTLKRSDELLVMVADTSVPPPRLALRTR
jgi:hypothetical protein